MDSKIAESRMRTVTTALAIFVLCTSSTHLVRMVIPDLIGPDTAWYQDTFVKSPPLASLRLPDGRFHVDASYEQQPGLIYGVHLLPAFVWSIMAPGQFNTAFRNKHPRIHATSGLLFFTISALLDVIGLYMIATRFTYSPANRAHLHFGLLPTFDVALSFLGIMFGISLMMALDAAWKRNFARHRIFTIVHTCIGLTVHYQRVMMYSQFIITGILATFSPDLFERLVGLPAQWSINFTDDIARIELDAFVLTFYGGAMLAMVTAWYALYPILNRGDTSTKQNSVDKKVM